MKIECQVRESVRRYRWIVGGVKRNLGRIGRWLCVTRVVDRDTSYYCWSSGQEQLKHSRKWTR